jgi:hypothetical protein
MEGTGSLRIGLRPPRRRAVLAAKSAFVLPLPLLLLSLLSFPLDQANDAHPCSSHRHLAPDGLRLNTYRSIEQHHGASR